MLKKSTLLFVSIFFLLFIGLSDYGYGHHRPGHGGGPGGGDGDGDVATYEVSFSGDVSGHSHDDWQGNFNGGPKSIGLQGTMVHIPDPNVGDVHDLSFFTSPGLFNPFHGDGDGMNGMRCFPFEFFPIRQAVVKQGRGGRADGRFNFLGQTHNTTGAPVDVTYRLRFFGVIEGAWPPLSGGPAILMRMTDWDLTVLGVGLDIKNISCIGESPEGGDPDFQVGILVRRTN